MTFSKLASFTIKKLDIISDVQERTIPKTQVVHVQDVDATIKLYPFQPSTVDCSALDSLLLGSNR